MTPRSLHSAQTSPGAYRTTGLPRPQIFFRAGACAALFAAVIGSAIVTKEFVSRRTLAPLAQVEAVEASGEESSFVSVEDSTPVFTPVADSTDAIIDPLAQPETKSADAGPEWPLDTRWFNGRPIRPKRVIWMTVTAYSPDERSCGDSADGITASLHSVWTNAMKMAAADSKVLPLGSMISVPGYDNNNVVPVLDRGGAIKGNRLDMLYPTHEIAGKWGVQKLPITVWEYADGLPADDYRKERDSR